jgi:hypothetical protein
MYPQPQERNRACETTSRIFAPGFCSAHIFIHALPEKNRAIAPADFSNRKHIRRHPFLWANPSGKGRWSHPSIVENFSTPKEWLSGRADLGDEPRKIFAELQQISLVDVVLPTRAGISIRKRCVSRPTDHQAILLQRLGLEVPARLEFAQL